jgi:hypothetical protein
MSGVLSAAHSALEIFSCPLNKTLSMSGIASTYVATWSPRNNYLSTSTEEPYTLVYGCRLDGL